MLYALSEYDWKKVINSIYAINSITRLEDFGNEVLSCFRTIIPCTQSTFFRLTNDGGISKSSDAVIFGAPAHFLDKFMEGCYDDDIYFAGFYINPITRTFRDADEVPEDVRKSSPLYNDIYSRENLEYGLRAVLCYDGELLGELAFFNSKESGDFSDKQLEILKETAPHIAQHLYFLLNHVKNSFNTSLEDRLIETFDLTKREAEVIMLVNNGASNTQISDELFISVSTVKKHIHSAYKKMNITTRRQIGSICSSL